MNPIKLLYLGGLPDDNRAEVACWAPMGFVLKVPGNVLVTPLFKNSRISAFKAYLGGSDPIKDLSMKVPPDVIFNGICSYESCTRAVAMAEEFCTRAEAKSIAVINHPSMLVNTTRDKCEEDFRELDHVFVPKTLKLSAPSLERIHEMISQGELKLPVILRTINDHNGENMVRLKDADSLGDLGVLPFDGRDYYAIEYVDNADENGLYKKFRLIKVGNQIFPIHLVFSPHWNVHASQRNEGVEAFPRARDEEIAYLLGPRDYLGQVLYDQLVEGLHKTGLDYVAVDFSVMPDGKALVFERNACFRAFATGPRFAELEQAQKNIADALVSLVIERAGQSVSN